MSGARGMLTRRSVLAGALALGASGALGTLFLRIGSRREGILLSAFENARGDQFIGGVDLGAARVFGAQVPVRAHGCAIDPNDPLRAIFFARRPGTIAFELRRDSMQVRKLFETPEGRHLSGHGVFSPQGDLLFVPEHDYERKRGVVSVRDTRSFRIVDELDTQGIDPHEVALTHGGRELMVANGGILTHPRTFRRKLNIPTMDPSLCLIDVTNGTCREQWRLEDHLLSIRHLALASDGTAAIGLQYEGEKQNAPGIVALYRPGRGLALLTAPESELGAFKGYVSSVAISEQHDLIAAACPFGERVACWTLSDERYLGSIGAREVYGLSRLADGTVLASQRDGTAFALEEIRLRSQFLSFDSAEPIRWDDHWTAVA
ncbi:MAG TPA: DUF1513 domain-containing protein [Steroidobacter sp.]